MGKEKRKKKELKRNAKKYEVDHAKALDEATAKANDLTEDKKDEILDVLLAELTAVVSRRISLAEQVFDRIVPIKTTLQLEDGRTLTITLK